VHNYEVLKMSTKFNQRTVGQYKAKQFHSRTRLI
jgi:hypothetical protein